MSDQISIDLWSWRRKKEFGSAYRCICATCVFSSQSLGPQNVFWMTINLCFQFCRDVARRFVSFKQNKWFIFRSVDDCSTKITAQIHHWKSLKFSCLPTYPPTPNQPSRAAHPAPCSHSISAGGDFYYYYRWDPQESVISSPNVCSISRGRAYFPHTNWTLPG